MLDSEVVFEKLRQKDGLMSMLLNVAPKKLIKTTLRENGEMNHKILEYIDNITVLVSNEEGIERIDR